MVTLCYSVQFSAIKNIDAIESHTCVLYTWYLVLEASFAIYRLSCCEAYHRSFVCAPFNIQHSAYREKKLVPETKCENEMRFIVLTPQSCVECISAPHNITKCYCRMSSSGIVFCNNINIVANQIHSAI